MPNLCSDATPLRVADSLFRRNMLGPSIGHIAASVTALLLVEKLGMDVVIPPWVPTIEAFAATHGWPLALLSGSVITAGIPLFGVGTLLTIPAMWGCTQWKIQKQRRLDWQMLWTSMPLVVFNYVLGVAVTIPAMMMLPKSSFDFTKLPSMALLARHAVIWLAIEEVVFFYVHRWMHLDKRVYGAIHKVHHKWHAPVAITAIYCHPVEHVVCNIFPLLLGPIICGSHVAAIAIFVMAGLVHTAAVHSGYWVCDDNGMHDEHHAKLNVNFGVLGVMDFLHGTYHLPEGASAPSQGKAS